MKYKIICLVLCCCSMISCDPETYLFEFYLVNNSEDTIGCAVYVHYANDKNSNDVRYILSSYPICPSDTVDFYAQHYGFDDSWGSYFEEENIDTLYICVLKNLSEDANDKRYKLPTGSNVLKIYKYYDKNTDMKTMVSPTITYP